MGIILRILIPCIRGSLELLIPPIFNLLVKKTVIYIKNKSNIRGKLK